MAKFKIVISKDEKTICEGEFEAEPFAEMEYKYYDTWIRGTNLGVIIKQLSDD